MTEKITKTHEEWEETLTPDQYEICINHGTEPPFSGKYNYSKFEGDYKCVCCGEELFSSDTKFDSGSGWPDNFIAWLDRTAQPAPATKRPTPRIMTPIQIKSRRSYRQPFQNAPREICQISLQDVSRSTSSRIVSRCGRMPILHLRYIPTRISQMASTFLCSARRVRPVEYGEFSR